MKMQESRQSYKIYSRKRLNIIRNKKENKNKKSIIYINILIVLVISIFVYFRITKAIEPIFSTICKEKAHEIATIVTNEEATNVMKKYKYEDMFNIEKDNERKYKNDWCKYWYNK
mgnify:FL=1